MYSSPYSSMGGMYGTGGGMYGTGGGMYGTGGMYGGGAYGGYGGMGGMGGMYGSPYGQFGMMGAPGLLSGVNQSVEQVGRISTMLQMASEALHMTFSSGVRLFTNLGMFSNEMGSVASALTAFHFLSRIYLKLKEKFLRMIGKKEAADEVKLKAEWEHPSQPEGAEQNPNDPQNQVMMLQHQQQQIHQTGHVSWISVFAAMFGILYLIKRIFRFFFPKRAPKPVLPPQPAAMPNGQTVHIISTPGGRHFVVSPQGQRCPVVSAVTGSPLNTSLLEVPPGHGLAMIAPNGQSIPLRLAARSPALMPSVPTAAVRQPLTPSNSLPQAAPAASTSTPTAPASSQSSSKSAADANASTSAADANAPARADANGPAPSWLSSSSSSNANGVVSPSLPTSTTAAAASVQQQQQAVAASPALNSAISSFSGAGSTFGGAMGSPYGGMTGGLGAYGSMGGYGSPYGSAYGTPGLGMGAGMY